MDHFWSHVCHWLLAFLGYPGSWWLSQLFIVCPLLLSPDHHPAPELGPSPFHCLFEHSLPDWSWFKMNGTPPSLEEKVRHCGDEQEYRLRLSRVTQNHSMIGPMMTLARSKARVSKWGMTGRVIIWSGVNLGRTEEKLEQRGLAGWESSWSCGSASAAGHDGNG